jgi:arylsulfatase A-like enzyme
MGRKTGRRAPSVLFLISHDLAPRHGCYGGQAITPHQDELAREGLRFESHYVHYPLCGPSRANLFTGCRPLTTRRFNNQPFMPEFRERMGEGFRTLPEQFRRNGYLTRGFGLVFHDVEDEPSWDKPIWRAPAGNPAAEAHPDIPRVLREGDNKDWATNEAYELIRQRWEKLQEEGYREKDLRDPSVTRKAQGPPVEAAEVGDEGYEDGMVTDAALSYLDSIPDGAPFFLAVGFVTGHTPFRAPRKYFDLYDRSSLRLPSWRLPPEGSPEWASGDSEPAQYYTEHGYEHPWRATESESRELLHGHLAAASYVDAQIGRLVTALEESGRYEDTIIVAVSDHGFHDGQHGYWGKHNLWDQSLRAPLIMRLPRRGLPLELRSSGERSEECVGRAIPGITEHVDIFPTLCELCGLQVPAHVEGTSLVQLIANHDREGKRATFAHRKHMWHDRIKAYEIAHTLRTSRYRYTEYRDAEGEPICRELFDYKEDPRERVNHHGRHRYRKAAAELKGILEEYLARWEGAIELSDRARGPG